MKKIAVFLATVFSVATVLQAGPDQVIQGDIDPVTITGLWSLNIASMRLDGSGAVLQTYTANSGDIGFGGDNAYFTDPDNITLTPEQIDTNGDGTPDAANPNYVAGRYDTIAHRAAPNFTRLDFSVSNNTSETFSVRATFNSNYLSIPVPEGGAALTGGTSVMHLTTGYEFYANGDVLTVVPTNVINEGEAQPVQNATPITLYADGTGNGVVSDLFRAYVALDFLPTVIPAGTYTGTVTWTLTESIS